MKTKDYTNTVITQVELKDTVIVYFIFNGKIYTVERKKINE